jgi:indolepyruvate ferredoxin oxidoreductase
VARDIGIRLYKVGMRGRWKRKACSEFAQRLEEILVVEEKRQILEYAIKEELYNWPTRSSARGRQVRRHRRMGNTSMVGADGDWLLPATYELSPAQIARAIASRISRYDLPVIRRAARIANASPIEAKEARC